MAEALRLTEADVQNCSWTLVEQTPEYRRYVGNGTHPVTGAPITVQKTEYLAEDELLRRNAFDRNEADGKRWSSGMGSEKGGNVPLIHVGRIPLNKYFSDFMGRFDDQDFMRWWLRRDENQPFRTRRGNI